ncbi:pyridoxamine 5'-phosphate oxidase family protein [Thermodesulfobacteriota bacterium]
MTLEELEKTVIRYMDSFTTMSLACSYGDEPWAAAVYYARQGLDLFFFSSPKSRHSEVFSRNSRASATIHGDYTGWKEIKGLQMEGRVEPIKGAIALTRATAAYLRRYPFVKEFFSSPESISTEIAAKVARVALYVFKPDYILYINNEEGFGKRWKLSIKEGQAFGEPVLV